MRLSFLTKRMSMIWHELLMIRYPSDGFWSQNDFQNNLFEGSKYLLLLSDKIDEIKTICHYCRLRKGNHGSSYGKMAKPVYGMHKFKLEDTRVISVCESTGLIHLKKT